MPPAGGPGRHHRGGGGGGLSLSLSPPAGGVSSPRLRWRPSREGARPQWAFAVRGPGRGRAGRAAPWRRRRLVWLGGGLFQAAWVAWAVLRRGRPGGGAGLRVAAVCADTGSCNALKPVLEEGLRDGAKVALHLTGATAKLFCAGRYALDPRIAVWLAPDAEPSAICARKGARVPVREFGRRREWDVLVASASASVAGTQAAAASLCVARSKKLSFLVQDMYGTSHRTLREVLRTCPERAGTFITFVGNDLTGRLIGEQVPGYAWAVVVNGAPQFDAAFRRRATFLAERAAVRRKLGLRAGDVLVFLVGQPHGAEELCQMAVAATAGRPRARVLVRLHPRAEPAARAAVETFRRERPDLFFDKAHSSALFKSSEEILPGADVVVSGHSTTGDFAILLGMPGVVYSQTAAFLSVLAREKGVRAQPQVEAGAAFAMRTAADLARVVDAIGEWAAAVDGHGVARVAPAMVRDPALRAVLEAQHKWSSKDDGKAAARSWAMIQG